MSLVTICKRVLKRFYRQELRWQELAFCTSMRFSQFGEDVFLEQYFYGQPSGFYVDVGAFHPFTYSNTYLFSRRGWRGINIEPNPVGFAEFVRHRPRDVNLNVAISNEEREVEFTCDGVFSGINDSTHLFQNRAEHATQIKIKTQTLQNVFQTHLPPDTDIDFMSVDCEGHDLEVLQSNDWQKYRPRVLLVEDHEQRSGVSLEEQLSEWGYRYLCTMRITKFFIATDDRRPRRV